MSQLLASRRRRAPTCSLARWSDGCRQISDYVVQPLTRPDVVDGAEDVDLPHAGGVRGTDLGGEFVARTFKDLVSAFAGAFVRHTCLLQLVRGIRHGPIITQGGWQSNVPTTLH